MTDDLHLILTPLSILGLHEFLLLCPALQVESLFFFPENVLLHLMYFVHAHSHACMCLPWLPLGNHSTFCRSQFSPYIM